MGTEGGSVCPFTVAQIKREKQGEKRREQDKNTQGVVLVTVRNINISSEKVSFITCRTDQIVLAHHQSELIEESVAI